MSIWKKDHDRNATQRLAVQDDIIHFDADFLHFPMFAPRWSKTLTTAHGRMDLPDYPRLFDKFPMMPLVSISDAQRTPLLSANWCAAVHHGLLADLYAAGRGAGGYLAFIGRISPEKGLDRAAEIARGAGLPLKIAAKVDNADRAYYNTKIRKLLKGPGVEFIGEIGDSDKKEFLGGAMMLLFPIDWPEPFGLVTIEATANGTPVIACRWGVVPEVIDHGVTGFVVDSVDEAVAAVPRSVALDRRVIRRRFAQRFTVERMACNCVALYNEVLRRGSMTALVLSTPADDQRDAA